DDPGAGTPHLQPACEGCRTRHRLRVALGRPPSAIEGKHRRLVSAEIEVTLDRTSGVQLHHVGPAIPQLDVADDRAFVYQIRAEGQAAEFPGAYEDGALHVRAAVGAARARRLDRGADPVVDLTALRQPDRGVGAADRTSPVVVDDRGSLRLHGNVDVATDRALVVQRGAVFQHDGGGNCLAGCYRQIGI